MAEILFDEIPESIFEAKPGELELFLGDTVFAAAEDLLLAGHADILRNSPGRLEAELLETAGSIPYLVKFVRTENIWLWDCDCRSHYPCEHLGTVILRIKNGEIPVTFLRKEERIVHVQEDPGVLFARLKEAKSLLAGREGEVKKLNLASGSQRFLGLVDELTASPELHGQGEPSSLVFLLSGGKGDPFLITPGLLLPALKGRKSSLEAFSPLKALAAPPNEEERLILDKILLSYQKAVLFSGTAGPFIRGKAALYSEEKRRFFQFREFSSLTLGFFFNRILQNDDLEFTPRFRPDSAGEEAAGFYDIDDVLVNEEKIFCIDGEAGEIHYADCRPATALLVSVFRQHSRQVSSAEIYRLQSLASERQISQVSFDFHLEEAVMTPGVPDCILKMKTGPDICRLSFWFRYGEQEIPPLSTARVLYAGLDNGGKTIILQSRNGDYEELMMEAVRAQFAEHLGMEKGPYNRFFGREDFDLEIGLGLNEFLDFYAAFLMEKEIEIRINDRKITRAAKLSFKVEPDLDWFDIRVEFSEGSGEILLDEDLLKANMVRRGNEYIILTPEDIQELVRLKKLGMDTSGFLKTSRDNLGVIDLIYDKTIGKENLLKDKKEILDKLQNFSSEPESLPENLAGTLRRYQETGYQRLCFWHRCGLNGCLADDMGLGKTIQTLALLQRLKETGRLSTSLLIAPVVTLPNWEDEIEKFTPGLSHVRHAGKTRLDSPEEGLAYDLILVSYQTLRRDLEFFKEIQYGYIILDEAHYVKNAASQTFKAIRSLKGEHRLSLTGTPLENSTLELWTQMNFLNPWLLGSLKDFRNTYSAPIERRNDDNIVDTLRKIISPFLLRRRKEEVLKDLPPKEEILLYTEMEEEQEEAYTTLKNTCRLRILEILDSKDPHKASVEILSFMLKLRQMVLFPFLVDRKLAAVPSCKMDTLSLLLEEILEENHKVLIFTQFTKVLEELEHHCRRQGYRYVKLTGATADRAVPVKQFQEDKNIQVFLLSLKAGGVGINLTAADYVILFDPWWNPAAEAQAVDRAHRIGQKRKVFSYKIIVRNSIEEKILRLQERKKDLADRLISGTGGSLQMLDREEILNLFV